MLGRVVELPADEFASVSGGGVVVFSLQELVVCISLEVFFGIHGMCLRIVAVGRFLHRDQIFKWAYAGGVVVCVVFQGQCEGALVPCVPAETVDVV